MPSQTEIRQAITNRIVDALKSGCIPPWRMPWIGCPNTGMLVNIMSTKRYRGINVLLLQLHQQRYGLKSKFYGTFQQWQRIAGKIKPRPSDVPPGEWGCQILFYKPIVRTELNETGDEVEVQYPLLRTYVVFSIDQVVGSHLDRFRASDVMANPDFVDYQPAEDAIAATGATIRLGGDHAYYKKPRPDGNGDYICCPPKHRFPKEKEYYAALLHELAHWSETRLDWQGSYAEGELRAEMAACFASAELGVPQSDDLSNATAYLANWLEAMESDPKYIFRASGDASKAVDYLLSFSQHEAEQPEEVLAG